MKRITVMAEHPDSGAVLVQRVVEDATPETVASVRALLPPYPPGTEVSVTVDEHVEGSLW